MESPETRDKSNRPTGRPPRGEYADKRKTLTTRITAKLRKQLEQAAEKSGRSLSQEIEFRLEQSFHDREALYREFGGESSYNLMRWLALTFWVAEQVTKKPWSEDEETYLIGLEAIKTIRTKGPLEVYYSEVFRNRMADEVSEAVLKAVSKSSRTKE